MKKSYRPGVYSAYDIRGDYKKTGGRFGFYCGGAKTKAGVSLPAGVVVKLSDLAQLKTYFTSESGGGNFFYACKAFLENGAPAVYALPVTINGTAGDSTGYSAGFSKLAEVKQSGIFLCDSNDLTVLQEMKKTILECSGGQKEKIGVVAVEAAQAVTTANLLNCERIVICCQAGKPLGAGETSKVFFSAAELAGKLTAAIPNANLNGLEMTGLSEVESVSEEKLESLLGAGITVLEQGEQGVECVRVVTSRTLTAGETDRTFSSVNTVLCIDDIIMTIRERLKSMMRGAPTGSFTLDSVASQVAVILSEKQEQGLLTDFEPPVAYQENNDPEICVVELEFHLASILSQIYLTAHISV